MHIRHEEDRMKGISHSIILVIIISFSSLSAEEYRGYANHMYILWQPNARAEALGRGYSTLTGNPFYVQYNPASTIFSKNSVVSFSHLEPNLLFTKSTYYNNIGASYNFGSYGAFAVNLLDFSWGDEVVSVDEYGKIVNKVIPHTSIYILNYSYQVMDKFSAGINANYFNDDFGIKDLTSFTFDLGLLKKFFISEKFIKQDLSLGLSISNLFNAGVETDGQRDALPSILRLSAAYQLDFNKNNVLPFHLNLSLFAEYKDIVSGKDYTEYKIGSELSLFNFLVFRVGYYREWRNDFGYPNNASKLSEYTYGFGIRIPFNEYIKNLPLMLEFDYSNLPTPIYNRDFEKAYKPYNIYSISISYSM